MNTDESLTTIREKAKLDRRHRLRYKRRRHKSEQDVLHSGAETKVLKDSLDSDDEAFYADTATHVAETFTLEEDFNERLFDAMADDEGAEYWRHYYAQPINTFERPSDDMTDDEYAAYVRRGMWQRQHGHSFSQSGSAHESRRPKTSPAEDPQGDCKARLMMRWHKYLETFSSSSTWTLKGVPWPTLSGSVSDLEKESISSFLSAAGSPQTVAKQELRRRWHPDKFSQLFGSRLHDQDKLMIMQKVTLVAQILNEITAEASGS